MQYEPNEVHDEHLDAFAHCLSGTDMNIKGQALNALAIIGEGAGKKYKDVLRLVEDKSAPALLTVAAVQTLAAMGSPAKPALPNLKKMLEEKKKPLEEKMLALKKLEASNKPLDPQLANEAIALDAIVKALEAAIKHLEEAKLVSPTQSPDPPKKP
jgi:DNA-binding transcriptional MerR regulator